MRTACKTLEFELGRATENLDAIVEATRQSGHPRIASDLQRDAEAAPDEWHPAAIVWSELAEIKAETAQRLAALLDEHKGQQPVKSFQVPGYILEAVRHVAARAGGQ